MKGNDIVVIHTSVILSPQPFFFKKGIIYGVPFYYIRSRSGNIYKVTVGFVVLKYIFNAVSHGCVRCCSLIDCLIDCHLPFTSFLISMIFSDMFSNSSDDGGMPEALAICAN